MQFRNCNNESKWLVHVMLVIVYVSLSLQHSHSSKCHSPHIIGLRVTGHTQASVFNAFSHTAYTIRHISLGKCSNKQPQFAEATWPRIAQ